MKAKILIGIALICLLLTGCVESNCEDKLLYQKEVTNIISYERNFGFMDDNYNCILELDGVRTTFNSEVCEAQIGDTIEYRDSCLWTYQEVRKK